MENIWIIEKGMSAVFLGGCTGFDLRKKTLPAVWLILNLLSGVMLLFYDHNFSYETAACLGEGVFLFLVSVITGEKIGKGDAIMVFITGLFIGFWWLQAVLFLALLYSVLGGIWKILRKKGTIRTGIAFAPCLLLGYLTVLFGSYAANL